MVLKHNYDESKIKTLSSLEHIRTRSSMYIGRLGDGTNSDDGIYVLLKEVIDNWPKFLELPSQRLRESEPGLRKRDTLKNTQQFPIFRRSDSISWR